jgi:regulator of sigma E protease
VNGVEPKTIGDAQKQIMIDAATQLMVERNGEKVAIELQPRYNELALDSGEKEIMAVRMPFYIDSLLAGQNAAKSELLKGDRIIAVDHAPVLFFNDFVQTLQTKKEQNITVTAVRGTDTVDVAVDVNDQGLVGIAPVGYEGLVERGHAFVTVHESYGLLASIPAGVNYGLETLGGYVSSLKLLFTKSGASQIGGFGAIGNMFPSTWNWQIFWNMTAFLSIILAFMNILPIPALDGGHVVFLLYEMITGRAPNQRVLEVAQMIGMLLLLGLLLFANGNDLFKWMSGN